MADVRQMSQLEVQMFTQINDLRAQLAESQSKVKELETAGIHSCWDECPRIACVQRRRIVELEAQLEKREPTKSQVKRIEAMMDARLNGRVRELEAENARLREAIQEAISISLRTALKEP